MLKQHLLLLRLLPEWEEEITNPSNREGSLQILENDNIIFSSISSRCYGADDEFQNCSSKHDFGAKFRRQMLASSFLPAKTDSCGNIAHRP